MAREALTIIDNATEAWLEQSGEDEARLHQVLDLLREVLKDPTIALPGAQGEPIHRWRVEARAAVGGR